VIVVIRVDHSFGRVGDGINPEKEEVGLEFKHNLMV